MYIIVIECCFFLRNKLVLPWQMLKIFTIAFYSIGLVENIVDLATCGGQGANFNVAQKNSLNLDTFKKKNAFCHIFIVKG